MDPATAVNTAANSLPPLNLNSLGGIVAAAGALGTACFGIVEAAKWTSLGEAGFRQIPKHLGQVLLDSLQLAYGPGYEQLLRDQYREDSQNQTAIAKTLRQGVRIGLNSTNAQAMAKYVGTVNPVALENAVRAAESGDSLDNQSRGVIGRFEVAVDARIDAALSRAKDNYLGTVRVSASILAIVISEVVMALLSGLGSNMNWLRAGLVGIMAVPLAPLANDLVAALQAATKALRS
jgi:hypothetical protein